jgi:energy-coupling factor transport system substrate-specific component
MKTRQIFQFRGSARIALILTTAISAIAFLWPFFISSHIINPQWIFLAAAPCALFLLLASIGSEALDSKSVALLGVLAALIAALRPLGTGAVGIEPMWFVLILAARVFGPSFGFLLGTFSMLISALFTGGIGPWLAYQCFAAGWIGFGIALIPKKLRGRSEILALALYGIFAAEFFGIAMDLQFWPWALGADSTLSYIPGGEFSINLSRFITYHFVSSMAWDIPRAIFTATLITVAGKPILHSLRRAHTRAAFATPIEFNERVIRLKEAQ